MCLCADIGRLMARYCIAFESMKRFMALKGNEGLAELVRLTVCSLTVGEGGWVTLLWATGGRDGSVS